MTELEVISF